MAHRPDLRIVVAAVALITAANACRSGGASGPGSGSAAVMAEAAKPATIAAPRLPAGVTAATIARGDSIFHAHACARCHGKDGVGGQNGPTLVKTAESPWLHSTGKYEEIVATIISGVPKDSLRDKTRRFQMNPRGSNPPISDDEVKAVAAYIWKLNHP